MLAASLSLLSGPQQNSRNDRLFGPTLLMLTGLGGQRHSRISGAGIAGRFALSERLMGCLTFGRGGAFGFALGFHVACCPGLGLKCDDVPNHGLEDPAGLCGNPSLNNEAM